MFLYRCSAICLCLLALSCCSVKEDRSGCPCLLRLDMSDAGAEAPVRVNVLASDGFACSGLYGSDGGQDVPEMLFRIPKGPAHVLAVAGDEGCFSDFSGLRIPLGKECPPVFMYMSSVDASGEYCEDKVRLCKNYCRISVRMATGPESPYPFSARIIGNVSGYSFMAVPEYGEFSCAMSQDGEGLWLILSHPPTGYSSPSSPPPDFGAWCVRREERMASAPTSITSRGYGRSTPTAIPASMARSMT